MHLLYIIYVYVCVLFFTAIDLIINNRNNKSIFEAISSTRAARLPSSSSPILLTAESILYNNGETQNVYENWPTITTTVVIELHYSCVCVGLALLYSVESHLMKTPNRHSDDVSTRSCIIYRCLTMPPRPYTFSRKKRVFLLPFARI